MTLSRHDLGLSQEYWEEQGRRLLCEGDLDRVACGRCRRRLVPAGSRFDHAPDAPAAPGARAVAATGVPCTQVSPCRVDGFTTQGLAVSGALLTLDTSKPLNWLRTRDGSWSYTVSEGWKFDRWGWDAIAVNADTTGTEWWWDC